MPETIRIINKAGATVYILGNPPRVIVSSSGGVIYMARTLRFKDITFTSTLYTAGALATDKVMIGPTLLATAAPANDETFPFLGIELSYKGITPFGMDLWFMTDSVTLGTLGAVVSISDTDALHARSFISLHTSEQKIWPGNSKWIKQGYYLPIAPKLTTDDIYLAAICTDGTPTFASGDLTARLWFE